MTGEKTTTTTTRRERCSTKRERDERRTARPRSWAGTLCPSLPMDTDTDTDVLVQRRASTKQQAAIKQRCAWKLWAGPHGWVGPVGCGRLCRRQGPRGSRERDCRREDRTTKDTARDEGKQTRPPGERLTDRHRTLRAATPRDTHTPAKGSSGERNKQAKRNCNRQTGPEARCSCVCGIFRVLRPSYCWIALHQNRRDARCSPPLFCSRC